MAENVTKGADEKFCESCGQVIKSAAEICPKGGEKWVSLISFIPPPLPHSSTAKPFARISAGKCICGAVEWANNSPQNPARAFPYRHTVRRASSNTPLCSGLPGMMRIHSGIPNDAQLRTAI